MRFLEMGIAFAAVGFVVANGVISLLTVLAWRFVRPAHRSAGSLFLLRILPAAGSAALVLGLVLPSFWLFEPRATTERAGPVLLVFMIVAGALVAAGLRRAVLSWRSTRRLEREWATAAIGSVRVGIPIRTYRVSSQMPLAALVGVIRPRLFVSAQFLDALSAEERKAVLDHEAGHAHSLDNFKRTAMRLAPDWLSFTSSGREIESAWALAAEEEADDHAVGLDRGRSLDVAGALLKAARLTPVRCAPASNFYDGATVARRVARLLSDQPVHRRPARSLAPRFAWFLALLGAAALLADPALRGTYAISEAAIQLLR